MKTFKCLRFKPYILKSFHAIMQFRNGYGISVIGGNELDHCGSFYCNRDTYEVAVLKNGKVCYDTPIADDVLGWQTPDDVTRIMKQIQEL